MSSYPNPERKLFRAMSRCFIATKSGAIVPPPIIDIHPISGKCNLDCRWCIGKADRETKVSLPELLSKGQVIFALGKILDPKWRTLWPNEFHICGNDSEPLLSDAVLPAIQFLKQRGRIVELITNGFFLHDNDEFIKCVARIEKLSISLDVTNNKDYRTFKCKEDSSVDNGYDRILNVIRSIHACKVKNKTNLEISVTFVATPKTYDKQEWKSCFEQLRGEGVVKIRVREDLLKTYGKTENLKKEIGEIGKELNNKEFNVHYKSPEKPLTDSDFSYCRGPRLWPTLAADGNLYPCAHTANSDYQPFANLMSANSLVELYQDLFWSSNNNFRRVDEIGCRRHCPSVLGRYNDYENDTKLSGVKLF